MEILKNSYNGTILVPAETLFLDQRIVFINGEITQEMANEFAKQMLYLTLVDKETPIKILINSEGGEIDAGLKMCDIVSECPCKTDAYCFGKAYSMAAILFESVNGTRYMIGHSKLMFHQPSISGSIQKNAGEMEELSAQLKEKNELLLRIVSEKSGISLAKLKKETEKDRFYDAEEANKTGLSDQTVTFSDIILQ